MFKTYIYRNRFLQIECNTSNLLKCLQTWPSQCPLTVYTSHCYSLAPFLFSAEILPARICVAPHPPVSFRHYAFTLTASESLARSRPGHKPSITWPRASSFHTQLKKWSNGRMKEVFRSRQMPRVPLSIRFPEVGWLQRGLGAQVSEDKAPFVPNACCSSTECFMMGFFFFFIPCSHILEITFICYSGYHMLRLKQQIIHFVSLFWKYKIFCSSFKLDYLRTK